MEKEIKAKATDKTKKKSYGGFWSSIAKWDVRGKSSKQLKEIIVDQRNCIQHQLTRIKKIKYVLEIYKARDKTKQLIREKEKNRQKTEEKALLASKIDRRDKAIEVREEHIEELEFTLKQQEREIAKLNRELTRTEETLVEVRTQKKRGYTKVVKEQLTPEATRLKRIAEKGVDTRTINSFEYLSRTRDFLKDVSITVEQLTIIMQADLLTNIKTKDMQIKSYRQLNILTELGYLNSNNAMGAAKYWYVSLKGQELLKKYKNKLSFGSSVLTKGI